MDLQGHARRVMADTNTILGEAQSWMGHFLTADQQKNEVITALLEKLQDEQAEIGQLKRDLAAEHKSRNNFQMESDRLESQHQRLAQKIIDGSFIAVLIDGDGAKFADIFFRNPAEGATRAAQALKQAVRDYVRVELPDLDDEDIPIFVRIYANLNGLAASMRLSGIIERDEDMKLFAEQLTNSRAEVDFVNVGRGKENADSKLRKMLGHYYKNLQCRKIFLACCHDNGYLHDLREYSDTVDVHKKIILVESTPAEPNFKSLGFPMTRFEGVFRSKTLSNETKHISGMPIRPLQQTTGVQAPIGPAAAATQRTVSTSSVEQQPPQRQATTPASTDSHRSPLPAIATAVPGSERTFASPNGGVSVSYATAGGSSIEHQNISVAPAKMKKQPKTILYNYEGSRIDPPIKHPTQGLSQNSYQAKLDKIVPNAFCNDHYLVGICRRTNCERIHNVDLNPGEIAIHRYKARTSVCPRGPECDDYDCYLSHHCLKDPRCTRGSSCKFANTDFGSLHLDSLEKLKPDMRWTEGINFPEHLQPA